MERRDAGLRPLRFDGKVVVVTGAGTSGPTPGIGAAIAETFARQGAKVAIVDLSRERGELTLAAVSKHGVATAVFVADIASSEDCREVVASVVQRFARIDVLVNNAGIAGRGSLRDVGDDTWARVLAVNLTGAMLMSRNALPWLEKAAGSIVNISSIGGTRASGDVAYSSSKGGLIAMTRDLAFSLGPGGVRVNCVAPGHVHTSMSDVSDAQVRELRRRAAVVEREGTAWDVAWATLFLASDQAAFITGVVLPVDGGASAAAPLSMLPRLMGS